MNGEMYDLTRITITTEYDENKELRKNFFIEFYPNKLYNLKFEKVSTKLWVCIPTRSALQFYKIYLTELYSTAYNSIEPINIESIIVDEKFQENEKHYEIGKVWMFSSSAFELDPNCEYTFKGDHVYDTESKTYKLLE